MFLNDRVETSGGWQNNDQGGSGRGQATAGTRAEAESGDEDHGQLDRFDQLHRRLKRIVKARGSLDLAEAEALREAQETQMWRRYGYSSLVEYMEIELGYAPRAAVERLRVANALPQLPQIAAAIEQGDLTFCGARELVRVATPETERVWLGATKDMNLREVESAVSGHRPGALPTDPPDPKLQTRILRFEVTEEVFAMMRQVQLLLEKERGERLRDSSLIEALCRSILDGARPATQGATPGPAIDVDGDDADADGGDGDDLSAIGTAVPPVRSMAAYQVAVTVCARCKTGWQDGAGVVVEMSPPAVERAFCDSQEIGWLTGDGTQRAKQAIPPNVRRTVMRRDHGKCQVPGCRSIRNVDLHHLIHREHGGTHTVDNLAVLCEAHHLAAHDGSIVIERMNGEIKVVREGRHAYTRVTRAVEAAAALRERGIDRRVVRDAMEKTRAHVGTRDLSVAQWIAIAEGHLEVNRS